MNIEIQSLLSYPFEGDVILQKYRSIKRDLLSLEVTRIKKRIAILGGFTTSYIKKSMELFLLKSGIEPIFYESEYNKFYEDAVYGNEELDSFAPEIVYICTSCMNLQYLPCVKDSKDDMDSKIEKEYNRFEKVWENVSKRYNAIIIQNNFDLYYENLLGNMDAYAYSGINAFIMTLNLKFADYARTHKGFYLNDIQLLSSKIGLRKWFDLNSYYAYKFSVALDSQPSLAYSVSKIIRSILGLSKKCLVLDLDNTLWGGVIGDDGLDGIQLGNETPIAEAYTTFQKYVLQLKERGIILAVCSKNDYNIAKSGFTHPDSILKYEDFAIFIANWEPKDYNIQNIAKELNIGLDSLVFIDDNPVERNLVRTSLPQVSVPEVDSENIFSYISIIEENGFFEPVSLSADDFKRADQYRENKQRNDLLESVSTYDDFLKSLNMKAEIAPFNSIYLERIAQLPNKTNQFNLTTKRYTLAELEQLSKDENCITLYGRLSDVFGDNGLVSVIAGHIKQNVLDVDLWLMSCRVLRRGMENAMFNKLINVALKKKLTGIRGFYFPTQKNGMVSELYQDFGFLLQEKLENGSVWYLDLTKNIKQKNSYITLLETKE